MKLFDNVLFRSLLICLVAAAMIIESFVSVKKAKSKKRKTGLIVLLLLRLLGGSILVVSLYNHWQNGILLGTFIILIALFFSVYVFTREDKE